MPEQTSEMARAIQDVTEKAELLVREEIALAKAEMTEKVTKLLKGAIFGVVAGVFAVFALIYLGHALAWGFNDLLDVTTVRADSHFFDLGAHSLTATRLVARISRTFGVDLPVSAVFAAPRLSDLARRVEDAILLDIIERRSTGEGRE